MSIDIHGTDTMVSEYLIYRGFCQSFKSFEAEKSKDVTKKFDISKLVDAIFTSLTNFDIENFINIWDFLSKRFFFHLNVENLSLCSVLKSDLIKFYLVNAKLKNREKITDFFSQYSHEILAHSGELLPGMCNINYRLYVFFILIGIAINW